MLILLHAPEEPWFWPHGGPSKKTEGFRMVQVCSGHSEWLVTIQLSGVAWQTKLGHVAPWRQVQGAKRERIKAKENWLLP